MTLNKNLENTYIINIRNEGKNNVQNNWKAGRKTLDSMYFLSLFHSDQVILHKLVCIANICLAADEMG